MSTLYQTILVVGLLLALLYTSAWYFFPRRSDCCKHCKGKIKRIRRKPLDRFFSILFPLCRVQCRACKKEAIRWSKSRQRIPEDERKRRSGNSKKKPRKKGSAGGKDRAR